MLLLAIPNFLRFVIALCTVICKEMRKTWNLDWLLRRAYNRQPCICSAWPYIAGNFIRFRPIQARWFWTVSRIPWVYHQISGGLPRALHKIHARYGEVARMAPDKLFFIAHSAWRDICGPGKTAVFKKDMKVYPRMAENVDSILTADDVNHPHHRKLLNRAFLSRALREQEPRFEHCRYASQRVFEH